MGDGPAQKGILLLYTFCSAIRNLLLLCLRLFFISLAAKLL
jgi:hypothetical protein